MSVSRAAKQALAAVGLRALLCGVAVVGMLSCGGGGGGGDGSGGSPERTEGVYSGFEPKVAGLSLEQALNWEYQDLGGGGGDGGIGAGADGDGGVGAGGDFGQFRDALLVVKYPDGSPVGNGQALTDATTGMVTIVPRKGYVGALYLELRGRAGATYYEEGRDTFVPFPEGQVIRAIVAAINHNIGITPFSEAAYRLLTEGSTSERAADPARPTATEIANANAKVREILNKQFPATLGVDDITRLPFIKSPTIGAGSIGIDARGRYGLVNGAFSKQAAMYNPNRSHPTLDAVAQLGADLLDGALDGMNGSQSAAPAAARTYDPNTLAGELSSALAEQSYRFGTDVAKGALPKVVNFANSRHQGYLFDASITADGRALDTVSGWEGDNSNGYAVGQSFNNLPGEARVYGVFGNLGHGSLFFKTNSANSQAKIFVIGDNVNGELGLGNKTPTGPTPVQVTLPGTPTHMAGGFAHTVARMADGSVYSWGDNSFGQLGTGSTTGSTTPLLVSLPRGAIAVAAANTASYALLDDGSVYTWGSSDRFGLLGDGNKDSVSLTPAPITALSQVVQITARDHDVAVLRRDGSVWHWGSFPADAAAPFAGGTPLPQPLVGLPAGVPIRKILSEQGVFAVLMADGSVYEWGVYFDIAAGTILRDIQPHRALNVPPLRDMMPGGYVGYGVRAFDRLTTMGVDYRGGMWKIRGRVAEEFDPANPTLQRSPPGHAAGAACESCHTALTDWPLTPAAPTTTDVCVPQSNVHGAGVNSFIREGTTCEKCHNPNLQPPAQLFPDGWLTCVRPSNLPPPSPPIVPPILSTACTIPVGHAFTPPGTVCATCHDSITATPLQGCAQPPSSALPTIPTTTTITAVVDDAGGTIGNGTSTTDKTPELRGTVASALAAGQSVGVLRNGTAIGTATLSGTNWSFVDPGAPNGTVTYTARINTGTGFGPTSNAYQIIIITIPTVSFTAAAQSVNEGTVATITAQLSSASSQAVTVPFTVGGTATNPADYTISASPLTIAAGNTTATVTVTVVADGVAEPNETVVVTMGTPTNATLGATTVHTLTIGAQPLPTVSFTAAAQSVSEGAVATITAQLSSPSSQQVTVPFTLGGTAGMPPADYLINASPLTIAAGNTTGTITVSVIADGVTEPNETVVVTMGAPTNATLGQTTVHTLTIIGVNPPPVLSNISYSQLGAINTCDIFGNPPPGTRFLVSYSYSDAGGDVRAGATTFVSYVFSNGSPGSFDDTQFTTIGGDGFTGTMNSEMCYRFGGATFVDVTITVTDLAGFVSQPIMVRILRPGGAN
ncbi:MAG: Calx-beta domain-containing protein [Burkholderiaceae bacterium]